MTETITEKKKEVIATMGSRKAKEELKKVDFYKKFFDKIKDRDIHTDDEVVFNYSVKLTYKVKTNEITTKLEGDIK